MSRVGPAQGRSGFRPFEIRPMFRRAVPVPSALRWLLVLFLCALAFGAQAGKKQSLLDKNQYAYSAAVRWGDMEGAWTLVDPDYRDKHPMTDLDFSRYEQIQVTSYRDLASQPGPDGTMLREVQIELVNRHTLQQRSMRYTEIWRYDPKGKVWWLATGLPDFWKER